MDNPFTVLEQRLNRLEGILEEIRDAQATSRTTLKPEQETPVKIDRVCQLLQISLSTARTWVKEGKIPCKRKGKRVFFFESEVLASLEQPLRWRA
jgi:excisionase family DNA binding protein